MQRPVLPSAPLRGLLDAPPAAIGCFDATGRALYANTAFTMVTGVQAGGVIEDAPLAAELRAIGAGKGAPRGGGRGGGRAPPGGVRLGGRGRMPVSGTLFLLEEGLIGMVLDAGAHEALAALAEEQSALRRGAPLGGGGAAGVGGGGRGPGAVFGGAPGGAGRLRPARGGARIRYDGDFALTVGR